MRRLTLILAAIAWSIGKANADASLRYDCAMDPAAYADKVLQMMDKGDLEAAYDNQFAQVFKQQLSLVEFRLQFLQLQAQLGDRGAFVSQLPQEDYPSAVPQKTRRLLGFMPIYPGMTGASPQFALLPPNSVAVRFQTLYPRLTVWEDVYVIVDSGGGCKIAGLWVGPALY